MVTYPEWYQKNTKLIQFIEPVVESGLPFALLFTGKPGTGKTALADIVYSHIYDIYADDHRFGAISISSSALYDEYLRACALEGKERNDAIEKVQKRIHYSLVVIDDLGCEIDTQASRTFFSNLLSAQYDAYREGKLNKCIITTNLDYTGIAKAYGERIADRIAEFYTVIKFPIESYRRSKMRVVNCETK